MIGSVVKINFDSTRIPKESNSYIYIYIYIYIYHMNCMQFNYNALPNEEIDRGTHTHNDYAYTFVPKPFGTVASLSLGKLARKGQCSKSSGDRIHGDRIHWGRNSRRDRHESRGTEFTGDRIHGGTGL